MSVSAPNSCENDEKEAVRRDREKALKRRIKDYQQRIDSLQMQLDEKCEAIRYCEGELVGLRCASQGKIVCRGPSDCHNVDIELLLLSVLLPFRLTFLQGRKLLYAENLSKKLHGCNKKKN